MCKTSITPNAQLEGGELIVIGSSCPNHQCQHHPVCDDEIPIIRVNDYTVVKETPVPIEFGETLNTRLGTLVSKLVNDDVVEVTEVKVIPK